MQDIKAISPVQESERFELLDVVRGLALFGIVTANMISYSMYLYLPEAAKLAMDTHAADRVLDFLEILLIEGKFYTIFSVLFGVGFSVLLSRARTKGLVFHRFYLRRVVVLFVIGFAHAILFWHNDILEAYAVCGALLLLVVTARDRTILTLAVLAYLMPAAAKLTGGIPVGALVAAQDVMFQSIGITRETLIVAWTQGDFKLIVSVNAAKLLDQISFVVGSGMVFKIYGCFLFGFYIGRHEAYKLIEAHREVLMRLAVVGIGIGLLLNLIYAVTFESDSWAEMLSGTVGVPILSCGYVALCCLIWLNNQGRRQLRHFAPVGRMALTNYVGQSVICSLIFYGTGLGLGGTMGPTFYLPIAVAVYALQVLVSRFWVARFAFGPVEWIWRMLTYGRWVPLARL